MDAYDAGDVGEGIEKMSVLKVVVAFYWKACYTKIKKVLPIERLP